MICEWGHDKIANSEFQTHFCIKTSEIFGIFFPIDLLDCFKDNLVLLVMVISMFHTQKISILIWHFSLVLQYM